MLEKKLLFLRLIFYSVKLYCEIIARSVSRTLYRSYYQTPQVSSQSAKSRDEDIKEKNIVIVGASFAGYFAARSIVESLPSDSPYRLVVIEPHSHFNFTWVLPRFCVIDGHEHKAFIPYGFYLPKGSVRWVKDRVATVERGRVCLTESREQIPYEFLLIATGSGTAGHGLDGLPSRVAKDEKEEGMELLRGMQRRIQTAKRIVVIGGGAAGVELAADTKQKYPEKDIVLIHSREAVMHRFGVELQSAALDALQALGVEVILGQRVLNEDLALREGAVKLTSGRKVACDFLVNCAGQKPASQLLAEVSASSITESGRISVKPTMQITDETLPNVYACGDVVEVGIRNQNSRAAMQQAKIAADNIALSARGKIPRHYYKAHWAESVIKLTLGLDKSITHFGNGKTELLFPSKEADLALMSDGSWRHWGAKPFEDELEPNRALDVEAAAGK